jgi:hypothetical protein
MVNDDDSTVEVVLNLEPLVAAIQAMGEAARQALEALNFWIAQMADVKEDET